MDVTQGEALALLLEGAKSRRAEYAITEAMDTVVTVLRERRGVTRSQALRLLTAHGAVAMGLADTAVDRTRDVSEQAKHRD